MEVIIEDEVWILTIAESSKKVIESPNGDKHIRIEAHLTKKMEG